MVRKKKKLKSREIIDISQFFVPASATIDKYSVYYDQLSGKVESIIPHDPNHEGRYIICDYDKVKPLLEEQEQMENYLIAIDNADDNHLGLIKKDQWLRTLTLAEEIIDIPKLDEQDWSMEFLIWVYTDKKKVEVMLNLNALTGFYKAGPGGEGLLGVANLEKLTLYFVNKHDPGIIYHRLDIDTRTLVNEQFILEDIEDWWTDDLANKLTIKTKKNFSRYAFTVENKFIDHKTILIHNKTQFKAKHESTDKCHFHMEVDPETSKLVIKSNIVDPQNYRMYKDLAIHVVDRYQPDYYHATLICPINALKDFGKFELDVTIDKDELTEYDFLFDNPYVTVAVGDIL